MAAIRIHARPVGHIPPRWTAPSTARSKSVSVPWQGLPTVHVSKQLGKFTGDTPRGTASVMMQIRKGVLHGWDVECTRRMAFMKQVCPRLCSPRKATQWARQAGLCSCRARFVGRGDIRTVEPTVLQVMIPDSLPLQAEHTGVPNRVQEQGSMSELIRCGHEDGRKTLVVGDQKWFPRGAGQSALEGPKWPHNQRHRIVDTAAAIRDWNRTRRKAGHSTPVLSTIQHGSELLTELSE